MKLKFISKPPVAADITPFDREADSALAFEPTDVTC
jgi:hypothetical protein